MRNEKKNYANQSFSYKELLIRLQQAESESGGKHFDFSQNTLGTCSLFSLLSDRLVSLKFRENSMTSEQAGLFLRAHFLTELDLGDNCLTDKGVSVLAQGTFSSLVLDKNQITDSSAKDLAANPWLISLDLSDNNINVSAILKAFTENVTLTSLNLQGNAGPLNQTELTKVLERNRLSAKEFLIACSKGLTDIVKQVLEAKQVSPYAYECTFEGHFSMPKANDSLDTGLHLAVKHKHTALIEYFVASYPQLLHVENNEGKTPIMVTNSEEIKKLLSTEPSNKIRSETKEHENEPVHKRARTTSALFNQSDDVDNNVCSIQATMEQCNV